MKIIIVIIFSFLFYSCNTIYRSENKYNKESEKEGLWIEYSNDSTFYNVYRYKNGNKHGIYKQYMNGRVTARGKYIDNQKNGKFIIYTGNRHLLFIREKASVRYYKDDKIVKSKIYNVGL